MTAASTGPSDGVVRIVFVCTGNQARSALAAALLRRHAGELPVLVESRGTSAVHGAPALSQMLVAGAALGLDLSDHRAALLGRGDLADADLVVGFEQYHVAAAVVDGGARRSRTFTLPELVELAQAPPDDVTDVRERVALVTEDAHARRAQGAPLEIDDPVGGTGEQFRATATQIDGLVDALATTVLGPVESRTLA
jgi:protein-tyrosine-phosphatase